MKIKEVKSLKKKTVITEKTPKFGSGLVCDGFFDMENHKISATGVFTLFYAWGYPCFRKWTTIVTLFDLPKGTTSILVSLGKKGIALKNSLQVIDLFSNESNNSMIINVTIPYKFTAPGLYEVIFSFKDYKGQIKIPFELRNHDWPVFSLEEKEFVKINQNVISKLRVNVQCDNCSYAYVFEEAVIDDEEETKGVKKFPQNGVFECLDCGKTLFLKDIQGQLRSSIKEALKEAMGRRSNV